MRRLPTREERAALDRARARRRHELLAQAELARVAVAQIARDCAALASGPAEEPRPERVDAQLARLEAARAAAQLARLLLEADDPERLGDLPEQLHAAIGRWRRASEGWWEARIVWRPRLAIGQDKATGTLSLDLVSLPFGPYYYRHWRQEGRQQTQYLGRERPQGFPAEQDVPALPEPIVLEPASPLGREALALAARLVACHNAEDDEDRCRRLRRLLRAAGRRVERRLRAERQGGVSQLGVPEEIVRTTIQDALAVAAATRELRPARAPTQAPPPPGVPAGAVLAGANPDVLARLDDLVRTLGKPTPLGREAGLAAYDDLTIGFAELRHLIGRRAALEEALRRWSAGEPADDPEVDDRLAGILAAALSVSSYRSLIARAAAELDALRSRGGARGAELNAWLNLALETRRELRRVGVQVDDMVSRARAQGVPAAVWIAAVG